MNPTAHTGITLEGVTKSYGHNLVLKDITATLDAGKIYGLLGANGAGKTTLMKVICNHVFRSGGTILIDGENPAENAPILARTCFVREDQSYNDSYNASQILAIMPAFYPEWDAALADELVAKFRLPLTTKLPKMSRGQRSALAIVLSLASMAPYTFLDEPYLGLDATAREIFYDALLTTYTEHPRTIIMSTHLIDEAADLMEEVFVIDGGRIVLQADVEQARSSAFIARGLEDDVRTLVGDREVLSERHLGRITSVMIKGTVTDEDETFADDHRISLEPASLQELVAAIGIHGLHREEAPK